MARRRAAGIREGAIGCAQFKAAIQQQFLGGERLQRHGQDERGGERAAEKPGDHRVAARFGSGSQRGMTVFRAVYNPGNAEVLHMSATICYEIQSDSDPGVAARSGMSCDQRMRRSSRAVSAL